MWHLGPPLSHPAIWNLEDCKRIRSCSHYMADLQHVIRHICSSKSYQNRNVSLLTRIQNLAHFDHSVLKAFSPVFAIDYFRRNKTDGWKSLGGILLAFTGVEALFADLGAFSKT